MRKRLLDWSMEQNEDGLPSPSPSTVSKHDIAIIGMDGRVAKANNLENYWQMVVDGEWCIRELPEQRKPDPEAFMSRMKHLGLAENEWEYSFEGFLDNISGFDAEFFHLSPKEAELMDPNQRLFLQAAWGALEDAGYGGKRIIGTKTGLFVGFSSDFGESYKDYIRLLAPDQEGLSIPGNIKSVIASRLSYLLDLKGPSMLVDTACSSSLVAVHMACQSIRNGECDMALAGGVKINLLPLVASMETDIGIRSSDSLTRTFDDQADGTGFGEGVACLLLKPLWKAVNDGDHIEAIIKGSAVNQDGRSSSLSAPNPSAQEELLIAAWEDANIQPESIAYLEAHGTGTRLGDPVEINGIQRAFSKYTDKRQFCAIGSVKSNIGHLDHAAGVAGLVKAIMALKHQVLPPTLHFNRPNRSIRLEETAVYVNDRMQVWPRGNTPRHCGVSSFGLSGTNCHIVLEEAPSLVLSKVDHTESNHLFTLSTRDEDTMHRLIREYVDFLETKAELSRLADICYTVNTGRGRYACRLAVVASSKEDLLAKLKGIATDPKQSSQSMQGVHYNCAVQGEEFRIVEIQDRRIKCAVESYMSEHEVDWEQLYEGIDVKKVSLPTYPFSAERRWVVAKEETSQPEVDIGPSDERLSIHKRNLSDWFYTATWKYLKLVTQPIPTSQQKPWVVFMDSHGIGTSIINQLRAEGNTVIAVSASLRYEVTNPHDVSMRVGDQNDYVTLFETPILKQAVSVNIVHLWGLNNSSSFETAQVNGLYSLILLSKTIGRLGMKDETKIQAVTDQLFDITGNESLNPDKATVLAGCKVIPQEYINISCQCVDLDMAGHPAGNTLAARLLEEFNADRLEPVIAMRHGKRLVQQIEESRSFAGRADASAIVQEAGNYLIVGGLGNIGFVVAEYFANIAHVHLILAGRTVLPERKDWDRMLVSGEVEVLVRAKMEKILRLEALGARVTLIQSDIADEQAMWKKVKDVEAVSGPIKGIIYAAGILEGESIELIDRIQIPHFEGQFQAKVKGLQVLNRIFEGHNLDFCVVFSSLSSVLGGLGFSAYSAANIFADHFVVKHNQTSANRWISIGWDAWQSERRDVSLRSTLDHYTMAYDEGLEALSRIIVMGNREYDHVVVSSGSLAERMNQWIRMGTVQHQSPPVRNAQGSLGTGMGSVASLDSLPAAISIEGKDNGSYTATEVKVADIWSKMLGLTKINIHDDLFSLGGDSIIALRIANQIGKELNISLQISDLFANMTVSRLSELIDTRSANETTIGVSYMNQAMIGSAFELSHAQKRIWAIQKMNPEMTAYNLISTLSIEAEVSLDLFYKALNRVVMRHASLRTYFAEDNGAPRQIIKPSADIVSEMIDLSTEDSPHIKLESQIRYQNSLPTELGEVPLRIKLYKLHERRYELYVNIHHIITDGWSMNIFSNELFEIYNGLITGHEIELEPVPLQYVDWVAEQEQLASSSRYLEMEGYWMNELSKPLPLLNFITDYKRPEFLTYKGGSVHFTLSNVLTQEVKAMSQREHITIQALLLATYFVLLQASTRDEDIIVGVPTTNRSRADLERVIGLFTNTVCIRVRLQPNDSFRDFAKYVSQKSLKAISNSQYPFDTLVSKINPERDPSRTPIFSAMFHFSNQIPQEVEGISLFDLNLLSKEESGQFTFRLEYNRDLFHEMTALMLGNYFQSLITHITDRPDITINELVRLVKDQRTQVSPEIQSIDFNF